MKYLNPTFSVPGGGRQYAEGYERTFGHGERGGAKAEPCACKNPRVAYWRNKMPICARCGGVVPEATP